VKVNSYSVLLALKYLWRHMQHEVVLELRFARHAPQFGD
jgi:hypothetical protein